MNFSDHWSDSRQNRFLASLSEDDMLPRRLRSDSLINLTADPSTGQAPTQVESILQKLDSWVGSHVHSHLPLFSVLKHAPSWRSYLGDGGGVQHVMHTAEDGGVHTVRSVLSSSGGGGGAKKGK